jgi:hypothetical protein
MRTAYSQTSCSVGDEVIFVTKDEWASVLALAHRWNFASIRALAIRKLLPITTPTDQIVLATQYGIDSWKPGAYVKICEHATWPTPDDCRRLGVEELIHIGQARETLRSLPVPVSSIVRQGLVSDIFGLSREACCSALPRPTWCLTWSAVDRRHAVSSPWRSRAP